MNESDSTDVSDSTGATRRTYDTILVPTDGSDGAEAAARHALNLAAAFDAQVHFLSVVDERVHGALPGADELSSEQRTELEGEAEAAVQRLDSLAAERDVSCDTVVRHGTPQEVIHQYARDHGVELLSMGTHGRTGLERLLLGSVTERVVRSSDVPVLTARLDPADTRYDHVLIPTDGSETASTAVDHGVAVADQFGATVHALSVVDVSGMVGAYDAGAALPDLVESLREGCEDAVAAVERVCLDRDVPVVTDVIEGTPYRTIGEYVDDNEIDLVTMGTHGRTGLDRLLLGSVTERTVRTSDAPVLTVR